ncbi:TPA: hypothetical protein EYP66_08115 [Candidatus Poribacteria bacterium]|nr:hypothetical protein [Candidatus Poribacteria bacterium]
MKTSVSPRRESSPGTRNQLRYYNLRLTLRLSLQERELLNRIAERIGKQPTNLALHYIKSGLRADFERLTANE